MPLFICDCCGAVDNTACGGNYWHGRYFAEGKGINPEHSPALCCKCYTGKWHDHFPYEICTQEVFLKIGASNFVYWMDGSEPQPDIHQNVAVRPKELYIQKDRSQKSKRQLKLLARCHKKK